MSVSVQVENRPLASLRGVLALYVVFHHIGLIDLVALHRVDCESALCNAIWAGATAVDAFFVLSGYILTAVYADLQPGGVMVFLARRVFRIYPLHLAVVGILLIRAAATGATIPWPDLPSIAALTHIWMLREPGWSPQSWSTAVELVCYALFPLALILLRTVRRPAFGLALVLGLAWLEYQVQARFLGAALGWPAVARGVTAFTLGMALHRLAAGLPPLSRLAATVGEALSIGGLAWYAATRDMLAMPLLWAGLILFLAQDRGLVARALHAPVLVWIGHTSFSIYLLHMVVLDVALTWALPGVAFPATVPSVVLWGLAQNAVTLGLSHLTWHWIEEPGRRLAYWKRASRADASIMSASGPQ